MFLSLLLLNAVINQHSDAVSVATDTEAIKYLASFGYLDPTLKNSSTASVAGETFDRAISHFQSFVGLNPTGILDEETSKWMRKPRCGVMDIIRDGFSTHRKRNVKQTLWNKKHLTYRIYKYTKHLEKSVVDQEIAKAFQVWADVTELTFSFVKTGNVDIAIRFETGSHADQDTPFDGPGTVLAHASFPPSGEAHFDDDETWTINSIGEIDLFQVAVHEFGHVLGLEHTDIKPAVMKPVYDAFEPDYKLEADDIEQIQKLYGDTVDNNWIKENIHEFTRALEKLNNELKETKRELADAKTAIENLKTILNTKKSDIENVDGKMPTSCKDLQKMGQRINGIFLVKGKTKIDAVFCDFNPTKNNEIKQKRIGHAGIKSESVYFYVQRNSPFSTPRTAIPFDHARVNKGNAMDLATGIFTSQRAGTYFFFFTGLASFPETTSPNRLHLGIGFYVDGNCIGRTKKEKTNTVENQYSPLNLQTTVDLVANNNIWLEIDLLSSGVVLHDAEGDNSWNHFTGWMLEEEIVATNF